MNDSAVTRSTAAVASPHVQCVEAADDVFRRNRHFVTRVLELTNLMMRYFSPEVSGVENVPETGPVLLIGNHSGLM
jgi:1-acyl-sn-glycerol-3-phosphate acyltransferase